VTSARRALGIFGTALAVVAALALAPAAGAATTPEVSLELLPEQLLEPPPPNETQRLLSESRRTTSYCALLAALDDIRPPNPEQVNEVVAFGQRYHQTTTFLDRRSEVSDPTARQRGAKIRTPDELLRTVETERATMYAFYARMLGARALRRAGDIDQAGLDRRIRLAFVKLMTSGFSEADQVLQDSGPRYCG
jgi:hypothetical protein